MEIIVAATMILGLLLAFLFVIPQFFKPNAAKTEAPNSKSKNIPKLRSSLAWQIQSNRIIFISFSSCDKDSGRFTKAEVSLHNKRTDCWVIIKNKVYDVTSYVEEHPGGDAILTNAGGDSTEGFYGPQHGTRVFDLIEDFCIGQLVE
ncbi:Cytochrome B5-like protein [Bienertia sinuspersici]